MGVSKVLSISLLVCLQLNSLHARDIPSSRFARDVAVSSAQPEIGSAVSQQQQQQQPEVLSKTENIPEKNSLSSKVIVSEQVPVPVPAAEEVKSPVLAENSAVKSETKIVAEKSNGSNEEAKDTVVVALLPSQSQSQSPAVLLVTSDNGNAMQDAHEKPEDLMASQQPQPQEMISPSQEEEEQQLPVNSPAGTEQNLEAQHPVAAVIVIPDKKVEIPINPVPKLESTQTSQVHAHASEPEQIVVAIVPDKLENSQEKAKDNEKFQLLPLTEVSPNSDYNSNSNSNEAAPVMMTNPLSAEKLTATPVLVALLEGQQQSPQTQVSQLEAGVQNPVADPQEKFSSSSSSNQINDSSPLDVIQIPLSTVVQTSRDHHRSENEIDQADSASQQTQDSHIDSVVIAPVPIAIQNTKEDTNSDSEDEKAEVLQGFTDGMTVQIIQTSNVTFQIQSTSQNNATLVEENKSGVQPASGEGAEVPAESVQNGEAQEDQLQIQAQPGPEQEKPLISAVILNALAGNPVGLLLGMPPNAGLTDFSFAAGLIPPQKPGAAPVSISSASGGSGPGFSGSTSASGGHTGITATSSGTAGSVNGSSSAGSPVPPARPPAPAAPSPAALAAAAPPTPVAGSPPPPPPAAAAPPPAAPAAAAPPPAAPAPTPAAGVTGIAVVKKDEDNSPSISRNASMHQYRQGLIMGSGGQISAGTISANTQLQQEIPAFLSPWYTPAAAPLAPPPPPASSQMVITIPGLPPPLAIPQLPSIFDFLPSFQSLFPPLISINNIPAPAPTPVQTVVAAVPSRPSQAQPVAVAQQPQSEPEDGSVSTFNFAMGILPVNKPQTEMPTFGTCIPSGTTCQTAINTRPCCSLQPCQIYSHGVLQTLSFGVVGMCP